MESKESFNNIVGNIEDDLDKKHEVLLEKAKNMSNEDKQLICDWLNHSHDFDAGWLNVSEYSVSVFKRLRKDMKRKFSMEEIFDGDTSEYKMWFDDLPRIKEFL